MGNMCAEMKEKVTFCAGRVVENPHKDLHIPEFPLAHTRARASIYGLFPEPQPLTSKFGTYFPRRMARAVRRGSPYPCPMAFTSSGLKELLN